VKDESFIGSVHSFHFRLRRRQIELLLNLFFISTFCCSLRVVPLRLCVSALKNCFLSLDHDHNLDLQAGGSFVIPLLRSGSETDELDTFS
jgi:hypothetical protein